MLSYINLDVDKAFDGDSRIVGTYANAFSSQYYLDLVVYYLWSVAKYFRYMFLPH